MCALQNGFHHEKGYIFFLKLGIFALGHQIPGLGTCFNFFFIKIGKLEDDISTFLSSRQKMDNNTLQILLRIANC